MTPEIPTEPNDRENAPDRKTQIADLMAELAALAQIIHDDSILLSQTATAIEEANEQIETMNAAHLSAIFNERFEINNKLVYTNDDQRKVALIQARNMNADFQAMRSARSTLAETSAAQKAAIEQNRNLHKSKLLLLEYYASFPAQ